MNFIMVVVGSTAVSAATGVIMLYVIMVAAVKQSTYRTG